MITGAESTGKSTLTEGLANYFGVPYIPEIARSYVEQLNRKYAFDDVENIARLQVKMLHDSIKNGDPLIFMDTWLIITKIWFEVVFGIVPEWIEKEIESTRIDLFLICDTDIPWIADPVRENGGENRIILQNKYIDEFKKHNFNYSIVSGLNEVRLTNAIHCVKNFL